MSDKSYTRKILTEISVDRYLLVKSEDRNVYPDLCGIFVWRCLP